jgi:hypothetical protein
MKKRVLLAGACVVLSGLSMIHAETLFTRPFLVVSPMKIDFGVLRLKHSATNSFLVENVGTGTLEGTAKVPPPFRILTGGKYKLIRNGAQVVTVVYTPDGSRTNTQLVTFTGGTSDVTATVTGRLSTKRWPYYLKQK